jgi:hypothetical protein
MDAPDPGDPLDVPSPDPAITAFDGMVRQRDVRHYVRDGDLQGLMAELVEVAYEIGWGRWSPEGKLHEEDWAALNTALRGYRQRITVELMNEAFGD